MPLAGEIAGVPVDREHPLWNQVLRAAPLADSWQGQLFAETDTTGEVVRVWGGDRVDWDKGYALPLHPLHAMPTLVVLTGGGKLTTVESALIEPQNENPFTWGTWRLDRGEPAPDEGFCPRCGLHPRGEHECVRYEPSYDMKRLARTHPANFEKLRIKHLSYTVLWGTLNLALAREGYLTLGAGNALYLTTKGWAKLRDVVGPYSYKEYEDAFLANGISEMFLGEKLALLLD